MNYFINLFYGFFYKQNIEKDKKVTFEDENVESLREEIINNIVKML